MTTVRFTIQLTEDEHTKLRWAAALEHRSLSRQAAIYIARCLRIDAAKLAYLRNDVAVDNLERLEEYAQWQAE